MIAEHVSEDVFKWGTSVRGNVSVNYRYGGVYAPQSTVGAKQPPSHDDYSFALDDLHDLGDANARWGDDAPPTQEALRYAALVLFQVSGAYPAPEVTARENGTVLLLWHDEKGFISIEIGEDRFGLVSSRPGYPSVRINGANSDISRQLPRRYAEPLTAASSSGYVSGSVSAGMRAILGSASRLSPYVGPATVTA